MSDSPYYCMDDCGWRGKIMQHAEKHHKGTGHRVGIETLTDHDVQAFPCKEEQ